ncbi:MAG: MoxR family ATPase [Chloroflexi bacterium]|nr:MoxR family ATPase [Chloroflexota bacterium]
METPWVGLISETAEKVKASIERVIVGKGDVIELVLVAVLCEGHVLIEDVPGIGKTMLAKATARSLGCTFRRIQCTPDLLPSDITGVSIFNQRTCEFEFKPGPVMTQVLLTDEINRATPRTQSALLECMEERQITIEGTTMPVPRPFLVLATQNPIELEGTFPLPEAQLDRFLLRLSMGYPTEEEEHAILLRFRLKNPIDELTPVVSSQQLLEMQRLVPQVFVGEDVEDYIVKVIRATRNHDAIELGASPRATLALYRTCQALAALQGRAFVIPDDVKRMAPFVLTHRIITSVQTHLKGRTAAQILDEVLASVPVPVEEVSSAR